MTDVSDESVDIFLVAFFTADAAFFADFGGGFSVSNLFSMSVSTVAFTAASCHRKNKLLVRLPGYTDAGIFQLTVSSTLANSGKLQDVRKKPQPSRNMENMTPLRVVSLGQVNLV